MEAVQDNGAAGLVVYLLLALVMVGCAGAGRPRLNAAFLELAPDRGDERTQPVVEIAVGHVRQHVHASPRQPGQQLGQVRRNADFDDGLVLVLDGVSGLVRYALNHASAHVHLSPFQGAAVAKAQPCEVSQRDQDLQFALGRVQQGAYLLAGQWALAVGLALFRLHVGKRVLRGDLAGVGQGAVEALEELQVLVHRPGGSPSADGFHEVGGHVRGDFRQ
ncbi:MAG: hypothetical protein BWX73_02607 [Lentisphaerae bacterium ADurb.Bin082]|nr:MAG: hypothetical protein BWX73_02607 [Lentisphaerae bacterium ADurb.Bin082]